MLGVSSELLSTASLVLHVVFFFFFQAEDGIRDDLVTGVQTCALPIYKAAVELVTKLHVTPESNPTSQSLQKGGDENLAALKKVSGKAFDKTYVDHEVAYHQAVIDAVDTTLIPSAQNAELKALLVKVRPAFVAHLDHAKKLQGELGK